MYKESNKMQFSYVFILKFVLQLTRYSSQSPLAWYVQTAVYRVWYPKGVKNTFRRFYLFIFSHKNGGVPRFCPMLKEILNLRALSLLWRAKVQIPKCCSQEPRQRSEWWHKLAFLTFIILLINHSKFYKNKQISCIS